MLANGQQYMESAWWLVVGPGIAIMVLVLLANYFGDALERFR
jgi:ABC-type dipeptide/oligopeptide/nickel transport system permease subunit